jgi:hypothetical protein
VVERLVLLSLTGEFLHPDDVIDRRFPIWRIFSCIQWAVLQYSKAAALLLLLEKYL